MGSLNTIHTSDTLGRGLSGPIWSSCPFDEIRRDPSYGNIVFSDFNSFGGTVSANVGTYSVDGIGSIKSFEDTTGTSILQLESSEVPGGIIRLTIPATDNHQVDFELGYGNGGMFSVLPGYKTFFETRIRIGGANGLAGQFCFFAGLAEKAMSGNDKIWADNATATGTKDLLGFAVNSATATILRSVYGVNGTATTLHASAQTLVTDTWYKIGFLCDGSYIHFYVNGVEVGTPVPQTAAESNVPDSILLTPYIGLKNGDGTNARTVDVDWLGCAQQYYQAN